MKWKLIVLTNKHLEISSISKFLENSDVSRAILKPVCQFRIPNPQTLKSVDFWCKLSSTFLVAEPRERCFELFRTQNSQKFPGFRPWTPLGRAYSAAPDSPAAQRFFSLLRSSKNRHPPKIAGYGTGKLWLTQPPFNDMWNMLNVSNKYITMTSLTSFPKV